MFAAAMSQLLRRFLDLFQNLIWYNRDAVDELCIIIYQLKVSRDVQTLSRVSMHMLLLRLYFAIGIGYIEYQNQLDKHRNPERYNLDDRQRRRRGGHADLLFTYRGLWCAHTRHRVRKSADNGDVYTDADRESMSGDKSRSRWYCPGTTRGGSFARSMDHRSVLGASGWVQRAAMRLARATRLRTRILQRICLWYLLVVAKDSGRYVGDVRGSRKPNRSNPLFDLVVQPSAEQRFERSREAFFGRWNRNPFVAFAGHVRRSRASCGWEFWSSVARFAFWFARFRSFASGRAAVKNGSNNVALRNEICEFVIVERSIFVASSWGYCEKRVKPWKLLRNSTKLYKRVTT